MASDNDRRGKKRSKAFYRKSAYGAKQHCPGINVLQPGIRGFLVMCNHDEKSAVRESYNILNEYADRWEETRKSSSELESTKQEEKNQVEVEEEEEEDCDDMEKALKREVEKLKTAANPSAEKRLQNIATKAKNCVFIRTSLPNPVEIVLSVMEDIAKHGLKKARYAARILPVVGTCRANTKDIEKLASDVLKPIFSKETDKDNPPLSCSILFKMRNNQGTSCGRESVIPAITQVVKDINPDVKFSWTDYSVAVLVEVVCTTCCIAVAPDYIRLRKYNLQELQQGPKDCTMKNEAADLKEGESSGEIESACDKAIVECESRENSQNKVEDNSSKISPQEVADSEVTGNEGNTVIPVSEPISEADDIDRANTNTNAAESSCQDLTENVNRVSQSESDCDKRDDVKDGEVVTEN